MLEQNFCLLLMSLLAVGGAGIPRSELPVVSSLIGLVLLQANSWTHSMASLEAMGALIFWDSACAGRRPVVASC